MRLGLIIGFLSTPCAVSIVMAHGLSISPVPEFSLSDTTNGLASNFEYYFAASVESNVVEVSTSETSFIKIPVAMCVPHLDAFGALKALTDSQWIQTSITNDCTLSFRRSFGPFSSAKVKFFNPPNPYLNHHFNCYGQMESIVSTAIVHRMLFDAGVVQIENVMRAFEEKMRVKKLFVKRSNVEKVSFSTSSPTSSGWYIELSVKAVGGDRCFFFMALIRKRNGEGQALTTLQVDVDI